MYTYLLLLPLLACLNNPMVTIPDSECNAASLLQSPVQVKYEGDCFFGKASGTGKAEWLVNGQPVIKYEGHFTEGLPNEEGNATIFNVIFEGDWDKGLPIKGKATYPRTPVFFGKSGTDTLPAFDKLVPVEKKPVIDMARVYNRIVYPEQARRNNLTGKVIAEVLISKDGLVEAAMITESSHPIFILPAMSALLQAKFVPAYRDGQPTEYWVTVPIAFTMK